MRADARVRGDEHEWRPTDGLISAKCMALLALTDVSWRRSIPFRCGAERK